MEMMVMLHLRIVAAEYVDLRCGNAGGFQLLLKDFQVVQDVADKIMP
jgi:hypothetical protein